VEDAKEQAGTESIKVRPVDRGIADDGAPPRLADPGATDDGGGFKA